MAGPTLYNVSPLEIYDGTSTVLLLLNRPGWSDRQTDRETEREKECVCVWGVYSGVFGYSTSGHLMMPPILKASGLERLQIALSEKPPPIF